MLSGANAFEISDIEKMNIGAHQPGVWHVTMVGPSPTFSTCVLIRLPMETLPRREDSSP
jgi:hypothetical protein